MSSVKDLEEMAETLHVSLEESKKDAVPFDPVLQTERSLANFLQRSLDDALDERAYARHMRDIIDSRIGEADIQYVMQFYDRILARINEREQGLLSPFIPRAGERVPVLDNNSGKPKSAEEMMTEGATKELLQSFGELKNLVDSLRSATRAEKIKEALVTEAESEGESK